MNSLKTGSSEPAADLQTRCSKQRSEFATPSLLSATSVVQNVTPSSRPAHRCCIAMEQSWRVRSCRLTLAASSAIRNCDSAEATATSAVPRSSLQQRHRNAAAAAAETERFQPDARVRFAASHSVAYRTSLHHSRSRFPQTPAF